MLLAGSKQVGGGGGRRKFMQRRRFADACLLPVNQRLLNEGARLRFGVK